VPKEAKAAPEKYGEVVHHLEDVVKRLEGGELTLEDSLKAFEEGIRLVRTGEKLLSHAEKRIEQLLSEDGEEKAAPLKLAPAGGQAAEAPKADDEDDDVPF
jgi:exodeoxyribonuclease VII small subunit